MKYLALITLYLLGVIVGTSSHRKPLSRAVGWAIYAGACAGIIGLGLIEYRKLGFQGDGFHYFSALRSFVEGHGFYEGPTFEFLLGNHAYLTLLIFAPVVAVVRDPVVLLLAMMASHLVSALLVYRLAVKLTESDPVNSLVPYIMGVLYLAYPTVFGVLYGRQLFQPDYLLPPLLLLLLHALVDGRSRRVSACIALIVLTKEEYIVTLPVMLVWALAGTCWIVRRPQLWRRAVIGQWAVVYALATAASLTIYVHQRMLNELDYAIRDIMQWEQLLVADSWKFMIEEMVVWGGPIIPMAFLVLLRRPGWRVIVYVVVSLVAFLPGRSLGNMLIYGGHWWFQYATWSDAVIAPVVFGTVLFAWNAARVSELSNRLKYATLLVSLLLAFHFGFYPELNTPWRFLNRAYTGAARGPHEHRGELEEVRERMLSERALVSRDYVIIPDYLEALFVGRVSHVRLAWWFKTEAPVWTKLVSDAAFVVVPRGHEWFEGVPDQIEPYQRLFLESEHYIVFTRREGAVTEGRRSRTAPGPSRM